MQGTEKSKTIEFPKEKEYRVGTHVFNIKREYHGSRKMDEIITDMIVKKEVANNR